MAFLTIPGNVKQASLPFNINKSAMGKDYIAIDQISGTKYNVFSFRPSGTGGPSKVHALINPFPTSIRQFIMDDISFKTLYNHSDMTVPSSGAAIQWKDLMNSIPCVQIREFLPDSRMDQIYNFFKAFMSGFSAATEEQEESLDAGKVQKSFGEKLKESLQNSSPLLNQFKWFLKILFEDSSTSIYKQVMTDKTLIPVSSTNLGDGYSDYILNFPYMMYNRMMGCTTTNIYEVPYNPQQLYKTTGSSGWETDEFSLGGKFSDSIIGKVLGGITSNIKISQSPVWKATAGEGDQLEVNFQLFNDYSSMALDSAIYNFLLVNTIVPNNMWTQYHIYQHSSDLYDVKLDGIKRLYMCTCDITVESKGVLRVPSDSILKRLSSTHLNDKYSTLTKDILRQKHLVRIPDVYDIKLEFKSLLPNNLNDYLFSYTETNNLYDEEKSHTDNMFTKMNQVLVDNVEQAWKDAGTQADIDALFED